MPLNIIQKKSWNVWNKANIAKVEEDERQAARKEKGLPPAEQDKKNPSLSSSSKINTTETLGTLLKSKDGVPFYLRKRSREKNDTKTAVDNDLATGALALAPQERVLRTAERIVADSMIDEARDRDERRKDTLDPMAKYISERRKRAKTEARSDDAGIKNNINISIGDFDFDINELRRRRLFREAAEKRRQEALLENWRLRVTATGTKEQRLGP